MKPLKMYDSDGSCFELYARPDGGPEPIALECSCSERSQPGIAWLSLEQAERVRDWLNEALKRLSGAV